MSYEAMVVKLTNIRPHSNAQKLQISTISGYQIVIGLTDKEEDLGIFFPEGGVLSEQLCKENNLYNKNFLNKDPEAKPGFFSERRRVRAQRFRGEISEGFWMPINCLAWAGDISKLKVGDTFDTFNGQKICEKYINPATLRMIGQKNRQKSKSEQKYDISMFHEHFDTKQVRYYIDKIPVGSVLYISSKLHGTSGRTARIKVKQKFHGFKNWWNSWCPLKFQNEQWLYISGTRKTVMMPDKLYDGGFYKNTDFRQVIHEKIESIGLHKGECIFYEIIGWPGEGQRPFMGEYTLEDKSLIKKYNNPMIFSYGCEVGTYDFYVYRITQVNEDGVEFDLSWPQIVERVRRLDLKLVPELTGPIVFESQEQLLDLCKKHADGSSTLDKRHIREGVVVRVEHPDMWISLKYKGYWFCELENIQKNDDNFVNIEEVV